MLYKIIFPPIYYNGGKTYVIYVDEIVIDANMDLLWHVEFLHVLWW